MPHELGHVVQQKLGIVRANAMHSSGVALNTDDSLEILLNGYEQWLQNNPRGALRIKTREETKSKIEKMISHSITTDKPEVVFDEDIDKKSSIPRLPEGAEMEVSYYFDSLDEFYKYLFLCEEDRSQVADTWLKVNVINTRAGDAIVMTVPAGYIIVDLGTNLNILLNYLSVKMNKRSPGGMKSRGIPILGSETCIIVTHNDSDHGGCREGYKGLNPELEKVIIKGYSQYMNSKYGTDLDNPPSTDDIANLQKLEVFLQSGQLHVFEPDPAMITKANHESIVISRRIGDDEAFVLCGDQEFDILQYVFHDLSVNDANTIRPVENMFINLPHHGSFTNNIPELFMEIKTLAKKIDASISSGKNNGNPSASFLTQGRHLWPQGTAFIFNGENDESIMDPEEQTEMRLFMTPNLWTREGVLKSAAIGRKSDGHTSASYSKLYGSESEYAQEDAEEVGKVSAMVTKTIGELSNTKTQKEDFKKIV